LIPLAKMKYTVHQAKTNLSRLLEEASAGKEVIIARGKEPVAKLVAIGTTRVKRQPGKLAGPDYVYAGRVRTPDRFGTLRSWIGVKVLLDTHALVWWFSEPAKLSKRATSNITNASNIVLVSAASAWELAIKRNLGKIDAMPL